jgi:hypothetical protein
MADEHLTIQQSTCPVCDSQDIEVFIEIPQVPVYCNVLYSTREDALNVPRADMRLGFCQVCGHIYNFAFDPDKLDYTQDYENSLHHSPRFQIYARSLAARLIERHNLYNKEIIDIGCGGGDFLRLLCDLGGNRGVGFEPSSAPDRFSDTNDNQITFIKDFYSEHYSNALLLIDSLTPMTIRLLLLRISTPNITLIIRRISSVADTSWSIFNFLWIFCLPYVMP